MKKRFQHILNIVHFLEVFLAAIIIVVVIISAVSILTGVYQDLIQRTFFNLQGFLSNVLLLVIGLELALVLIKHTPESVLQVIIFAVARKVLIFAEASFEIAIGVVALAGLFAIRKYLLLKTEKGEFD